jgi:hypothetical protein
VALAVGFCCRTGSAVAVAVDGTAYAGRWDVDLLAPATPGQLYHAAAGRPEAQAAAMVQAGVAAVGATAGERLDELLAALGTRPRVGVVTGDHPVPDGMPVERILAAHPLMHAAEGQLYRDALLDAAAARGLAAHGVARGNAEAMLEGELRETVAGLGAAAGRPWRKEHKLAAVAALVAAAR